LFLLLLAALLAGCAWKPRGDNFRQVMERQVGKRADAPDFYPVLYRLRQVDSRPIANGRREDKYLAGYQGKCEVSFEVDPANGLVTGWRADPRDSNCVIETRQP
jgi:hypothetical protein